MIFQGKDGDLRLFERGAGGVGDQVYYLEVLFVDMNFSGPIKRPKTEERIIMNRNIFDSGTHHVEGGDNIVFDPIEFTFTCRIADTVNTRVLLDWLSGVTALDGTTVIYSWKGKTPIAGNYNGRYYTAGVSLPAFAGSDKSAYRVEVLWDSTLDNGLRYEEVYFPPERQTLTEAEEGVTLNCTGLVYGDVSRITAFWTYGATPPISVI